MASGLQDKLAEVFPYFCRRVCLTCNGNARDMLENCPIIKLDAFLWLRSQHHNGDGHHPAQHLSEEVLAIVTDELVQKVGKNGIHQSQKKNTEPPV